MENKKIFMENKKLNMENDKKGRIYIFQFHSFSRHLQMLLTYE